MSTPDPEQVFVDEERDAVAPEGPAPDDPEATTAEHGSGPQPPDEEQP